MYAQTRNNPGRIDGSIPPTSRQVPERRDLPASCRRRAPAAAERPSADSGRSRYPARTGSDPTAGAEPYANAFAPLVQGTGGAGKPGLTRLING